jgi:Fe-S oxidoreductase
MTTKRFQFTKRFVRERCDSCGLCFSECPVLRLPIEQAQQEIRLLLDSGVSQVLHRCTGCMACNTLCPQDANPHTLIMSRWQDRYRRLGLPQVAGLVLPYQEPNLYTVALKSLPGDEGALVRQWEQNWLKPPADTMIYAGCNMLLQPFLLDSTLLGNVPIFGSLKLCCGEPLYRMGCWDAARTAAVHVAAEFERMGLERVIVPCLAGYHLFKYVYPQIFEVRIKAEVLSIEDWLHERITSGQIPIKPLNQTAVLHDNCWPKASGDELFQKVRDLLSAVGVTVIEPENTRERALCCGMCSGAAQLRLRDIVRTARDRLDELDRTKADMMINYCGGCNWLFSLVNQMLLARYKTPSYHLLEVVQMAAGETPKHRTAQRTRRVMASMTPRLLARYLNRRRFWIYTVAGEPVQRWE